MSATKLSRRRGPKPDRRRALELLAGSRDGMTARPRMGMRQRVRPR